MMLLDLNTLKKLRKKEKSSLKSTEEKNHKPIKLLKKMLKLKPLKLLKQEEEKDKAIKLVSNTYKDLENKDIYFIGIEQDSRSVDIFDYKTPTDKNEIVIVMGEEVSGMESWQINVCNDIVEIPMNGDKESLNVSVAFGVAVYQLLKNSK